MKIKKVLLNAMMLFDVRNTIEKEKKIKLKLLRYRFNYLSSSDMCKSFNKTKNLEENKTQVNTIENNLANLIKNV